MRTARRSRSVVAAASPALCALSIAACGDLLDVDQDQPDPANAEAQIMSAIALFECGYSAFSWAALGFEDAVEPRSLPTSELHVFPPTPPRGECDTGHTNVSWFDPIMGARAMLSNANGTGVYDLLRDEWDLEFEERLSAIAAIYMAAALDHFGEFYCEMALDGGDMMSPTDVLALAESWINDRALVHVVTNGDFALPNGIATSAETMAYALRARIRWARGDLAAASADAAMVEQGFTAWVTRDAERTRRNMVHLGASDGVSYLTYPNIFWNGAIRQPNPATGIPWPDPIPFTGYVFLGVLPDGRAVSDTGAPVFWASGRNSMEEPVTLSNGAVPDTRVPHEFHSRSGPSGKYDVPWRYESAQDDIPLVDWEEMWLIRAEHEGGQGAIDRVNELRTATGLPLITYVDGATATPQQIRLMLLEERRRALFSEGGRYWSTKIQNADVLWFPRGEGQTGLFPLQGGVRLAMPDIEYTTNPHFVARGGLAARGTGCGPVEAPVFP